MHILKWYVWGGAREASFPISSQVMLPLLVHELFLKSKATDHVFRTLLSKPKATLQGKIVTVLMRGIISVSIITLLPYFFHPATLTTHSLSSYYVPSLDLLGTVNYALPIEQAVNTTSHFVSILPKFK